MKVAIVGLPKSGKSTVFAAVTGLSMDPFAPPQAHQGVVRVPDPRLNYLTGLYKPKKVTQATIEFTDIPGCSLSDAHGRDAWKQLLPTVRQAEALVAVVRDFKNDAVPAYRDRIDAQSDFDEVWAELIFADLDSVTTRLDRIEKALKKPTGTQDAQKHEMALLHRCKEALESDAPLSTVLHAESDRAAVSSFSFLTQKPIICVRNVSDDATATATPVQAKHSAGSITLSASIEAEIAALDPADRAAFLADLGLQAPAKDRLVQTCYQAMGLISFLTMGEDEVRAWTITRGSTAVEAAGKIHSDLARGFVRAETVSYDELVTHKDLKGAKAAGKVRKEGKTYIVADGDILNILSST
jgi:GTP-binding protein YchF